VATPLGFLLSLLGVILNRDRAAGVLGLVISGGLLAFALLGMLG
jgi:hypothetical protein